MSVELPTKGNGDKFQVRVLVSNEVFIGRGETPIEATEKCCLKAVKFIRTYWDKKAKRVLPLPERMSMGRSGGDAPGGGSGPSKAKQDRKESPAKKSSQKQQVVEVQEEPQELEQIFEVESNR